MMIQSAISPNRAMIWNAFANSPFGGSGLRGLGLGAWDPGMPEFGITPEEAVIAAPPTPPSSVPSWGSGAAGAIGYGTAAGMQLLNPQRSGTENLLISAPQMVGAGLSTASALGSTWATAAIPVVGPIIAGVTIGLTMLFARKGPKQKVATTAIVDKVEPMLRQNVDAYLADPTAAKQQQAIANFNAGWQYVVEHCGIPEMGTPGRNCISERDRGGRWDWYALYADPILNTPPRPSAAATAASTAASTIGSAISSIFGGGTGDPGSGGSGSSSTLIAAAGAALVLYAIFGGKS